ncbi:MAG: branched-chain amino acid transaminase [Patescibacteria group bacterium]
MKTDAFPYAFFQGKIVPIEDAKISIMTNGLQYGIGFFGGIRGYYNEQKKHISMFRIDDHFKRFTNAAKILGGELPYTQEELKKITLELVEKNTPQTNFYIRLYGYISHTKLSPNLTDARFDFNSYMIPLEEYMPMGKGLSLLVSSWQRINDNSISTLAKASGGYINSALARKEANENGYDEAILLNKFGNVAEGSAENIFIVRDGTLITPGFSEGVLEGITRKSVIEIAQDVGIEVIERPIPRSELYIADEAFLTGTACQVAWIEKIDNRVIGSGKIGTITEKLKEKFFAAVKGDDDQYAQWCTKIKIK